MPPMTGGCGGRRAGDGADGSGANQGFLKNTPVEINEAEVPIKVLRYGLAKDSGGPGLNRGGLGTEMRFKVFAPNTRITARNRDRTRFTGWGIAGGKAGLASKFILNPDSPRQVDLRNTDILKVGPGDVIHVTRGGAGGWGDPLERDPNLVLLDVKRSFVSVEKAEAEYGVVIGHGEVDKVATERARAAQAAARRSEGFFDYGAERAAFEQLWTEANYAALTELLAQAPVHWRFYLKHRLFAALAALPAVEHKGDGSDVHQAYATLLLEFPQLRVQAAE